jgi:hypothetical protein
MKVVVVFIDNRYGKNIHIFSSWRLAEAFSIEWKKDSLEEKGIKPTDENIRRFEELVPEESIDMTDVIMDEV